MRCESCSSEFVVEAHVYLCPECQSVDLELIDGQELLIKNIEGEN